MAELGEVRRLRILDLVQRHGSVRVSELSDLFHVTPETIRREINRLAREGRLARVHGGAVPAGDEVPFQLRAGRQLDEKNAIAVAAARLVDDGDVIALDASTTALALANELLARRPNALVVVTNGAELPLRLGGTPAVSVLSLGGTLRWRSRSYVGPLALRALENYRVRKAFISCQGFTRECGPSESNEAEAEVKAAMVRAADEVVLLVDHTKWGRNALVPICGLGPITRIVTDQAPPPHERQALDLDGVRLDVADCAALAPAGGHHS